MLVQARPLATQVERILRKRLREGVYAPGARMPSESELAAEFGVSRATVRTVLAKLAAHGLVIRRQGDGTYVNSRLGQSKAHFGNLWDFNCLIESSGFAPSIQLLEREVRKAKPEEARALALPEGAGLLFMRRLFFADETPVILADNLFPLALFRVAPEQVDGTLPIRKLIRQFTGREIGFAITEIHATAATSAVAALLPRRKSGASMLYLEMSFYGKDSTPLVMGQSYFDDTVLRLSLVQAW